MPLSNILSIQVRPESVGRYEELVQELAQGAQRKEDSFHWTAHSTVFGPGPMIHFVSTAESFAALQTRGQPQKMIARVLGEDRAAKWLEAAGAAALAQESAVTTDRLDFSYTRSEWRPQDSPLAMVTHIWVRPGGREAFEELMRKLAEAIPKVDDPATLMTGQTIVGDLSRYYAVRPLNDLGELDDQRPADVLLNDAFGAAEGGLIYRTAAEAIREIRREVLMYRGDLSNPE